MGDVPFFVFMCGAVIVVLFGAAIWHLQRRIERAEETAIRQAAVHRAAIGSTRAVLSDFKLFVAQNYVTKDHAQ